MVKIQVLIEDTGGRGVGYVLAPWVLPVGGCVLCGGCRIMGRRLVGVNRMPRATSPGVNVGVCNVRAGLAAIRAQLGAKSI